jgi:hypothetical protein
MEGDTKDTGSESETAKYARWIIGILGFLVLFLIAAFSIYRKQTG